MIFADKKSARDKRLLRLERERDRLHLAERHAPIVPLERPYQRGWVKTFGLRKDALHHPDRAAFEAVLAVVNQRVYSRRDDFVDRTGRPIVLNPRVIGRRQWRKLAWTARHRRLFAYGIWSDDAVSFDRIHTLCHWRRRGFKLMTAWWLQEQVLPFMITHRRECLPDVESRLAEIESHLRHTCGYERLLRLHGRRCRWRDAPRASRLRAEIAADEASSQPD